MDRGFDAAVGEKTKRNANLGPALLVRVDSWMLPAEARGMTHPVAAPAERAVAVVVADCALLTRLRRR